MNYNFILKLKIWNPNKMIIQWLQIMKKQQTISLKTKIAS